jgi:hypothetical protein
VSGRILLTKFRPCQTNGSHWRTRMCHRRNDARTQISLKVSRHKTQEAHRRPQTSDLLLLDVGADLLVRGGLLETARNVDNGHHSGELAACP